MPEVHDGEHGIALSFFVIAVRMPLLMFSRTDGNRVSVRARANYTDLVFSFALALLTRIKNSEQYRDIPVIMYSTSASNLDKQKAKKLRASGFLTKPSDFRMLVDILKKLAAMEEVSLWELSER